MGKNINNCFNHTLKGASSVEFLDNIQKLGGDGVRYLLKPFKAVVK